MKEKKGKKKFKRDLSELIECKGPVYENCLECPDLNECQKDVLDYFTRIPNIIIDKLLAELTPTEWKICTYLLRIRGYNPDHRIAYNSSFCTQDEISKKCGLGDDTVRKCIKSLIKKNFVSTAMLEGNVYEDDSGKKKVRRTGTRYCFNWMNNIGKKQANKP